MMVATTFSIPRFQFSLPLFMVVGSAIAFLMGVALCNPGLLGGGAVALCATYREWHRCLPSPTSDQATRRCRPSHVVERCEAKVTSKPTPPTTRQHNTTNTSDLVDQLISTGRYALLLHPDTVAHLSDRQRERVVDVMEQAMSIVPEGQVLVGVSAERATWGGTSAAATNDGVQSVSGFYIDRFAVTNAEFQQFVDAGGYENFEMWPDEALPALFEFVDQTGVPGPRYWANGSHAPQDATLPVVGISWYEAAAYAKWVGKRFLTDAEWTKAAAWPVETTPGRITQRRYPWGDSFESRRANLWNSGANGLVSVEAFPHGSTLGGVYQLIGNVWEWTSGEFVEATDASPVNDSYRTLHGGAFNTYFENQATCHFRSGEAPLARRDNIGFRLALSIDEMTDFDDDPNDNPNDDPHAELELEDWPDREPAIVG